MKDYSKIITGMTSIPWMITEPAMKLICQIVEEHIHGNMSQEDIRIRYQQSQQERQDRHNGKQVRGIGVLEVAGPIFPKANLMTELSGATSIEQFRSDFRAMMMDDSIDAILLDLDSPGGASSQISEMAAEIRAAREVKTIWALANTSATSAAYYLGCSADKMFASPSSFVANIGTIMVYRDDSKQNEMFGIVETPIASSKIKAVGHGPLDQETTAYLQSLVDDTNDDFVTGVALGRRVSEETVRNDYGDGAVMTAKQGLEAGVVDGVADFDSVVTQLLTSTSTQGGSIGRGERVAATTVIVNNVKQTDDLDKQHGDPGPTGEPIPREPAEKDDPAIKGGWRRDTPPPPAPQQTNEGGLDNMDHEQLVALASALGVDIGEDDDDATIYTNVLEAASDVEPLITATAESRDFARDYPEQAARMLELENTNRESRADQFASEFESVTREIGEGDDKKTKTFGYSALMVSKIKEAHVKIAARSFTHEDLSGLLNTAFDSVVDLDEDGSSRMIEKKPFDSNASRQEVRKQFADLVSEIRNEDNLSRREAIAEAARREPELAKAYASK
jgi:signal peptide peptidase SppA